MVAVTWSLLQVSSWPGLGLPSSSRCRSCSWEALKNGKGWAMTSPPRNQSMEHCFTNKSEFYLRFSFRHIVTSFLLKPFFLAAVFSVDVVVDGVVAVAVVRVVVVVVVVDSAPFQSASGNKSLLQLISFVFVARSAPRKR